MAKRKENSDLHSIKLETGTAGKCRLQPTE